MKLKIEGTVSYCGLVCLACPIYWATWEEDEQKKEKMKAEIARRCNEEYETEFGPEDITDCDGCRTEGGRLFAGSTRCEIRKCAVIRAYENCAHCSEYPCAKLEEVFATDSSAKARLDVIRSKL
jgi:hypothetical protein